jgi:uncharacterized protein
LVRVSNAPEHGFADTGDTHAMDSLWLSVIVGAAAAGFVQGLSGFAFGMVSMSIWVWTVEPRLAASMAVFGSFTGQVIAAVTVRRGFDLPMLLPYVVGGLVGLPLGVMILPLMDVELFKAFLGTLLVCFCPAMLFATRLPRITHGGKVADGVAGALGGAMGALGGFTGVIPTLWCTLRGVGKDRQRAVVQNFNLAMLTVALATYLGTGIITPDMWPKLAVVAPAMLVPSLLGARLYTRLDEVAFRRLVLGLLTCSGVVLLASAVPRLLARVG